MIQIYRELKNLIDAGQPCVLAKLVSTSGSSPQNTGAKVIFLPNGQIIGTIGGGCVEAEARRIALDCLRTKKTHLFELKLDDDFGWDDGLICGGRVNIFINPFPARSADAFDAALRSAERRDATAICMFVRGEGLAGRLFSLDLISSSPEAARFETAVRSAAAEVIASGREKLVDLGDSTSVYIEPVLPRPIVVIAGAGHVGASLAQITSMCGFEVVIVDDRPSFANKDRLPFADRVVVDDIPAFLKDFPVNNQTYVVIVTRGHRHDAHCLREVVKSNAKYVGMIGSKRKICVIYEELLRDGLATPEELARVHSPLGFDIGAKEVGEIAVSIAAELVAVRRDVEGSSVAQMKYSPPFLHAVPA